jgi:hypothetical protein
MIGGIGRGILHTYIGIVHIPIMEDSDGNTKMLDRRTGTPTVRRLFVMFYCICTSMALKT